MEVDQIDAVVLAKELAEIYSTPTPKGWPEPKKVNDLYIGLIVVFTIVGVRYLYPESKHESYLITIRYNLWYKGKYS